MIKKYLLPPVLLLFALVALSCDELVDPVAITPGDIQPVITSPLMATVNEDGAVTIDVEVEEAGDLSIQITNAPDNGTAQVVQTAAKRATGREQELEAAGTTARVITAEASKAVGVAQIVAGQIEYTPEDDFSGTDSFTFIVRDSASGSASEPATMIVTVTPQPDAPVVAAGIQNQQVLPGEVFTTNLSADNVFRDADGEALTYTASVLDESVATVTLEGDVLRVRAGDAAGRSTTITVRATDPGGLAAETTFEFTVSDNPNRAPEVVGSIGAQVLGVGASRSFDLSQVFSDPDGDALTFSATSTNSGAVSTTISGNMLTIMRIAEGFVAITVQANDGFATSQPLTFTVTDPGSPFVSNPISDQTIEQGQTFTVDLNTVFSDSDSPTLTYSAESSNTLFASVSVTGSTLTVLGATPGMATITVTASDGDPNSTNATDIFTVTVQAVGGNPPVVSNPIPDQSLEAGQSQQIALAAAFSDPDGDALTFETVSSNTTVATVSVSGSTLTLNALSEGSSTISVTASDGTGMVTDQFTLMVTETGRPPVVSNPIQDQRLAPGGTRMITLTTVFTDPDGDALTFSAVSSNTNVATVSITDATLTIEAGATGTATITVTADDSDASTANASDQFTVMVSQQNGPPVVSSPIPDQMLQIGQSTTLALNTFFSDPDGDVLTFTAEISNTNFATISITGSTLRLSGVIAGTATITVNASDGLATATDQFTLTVTSSGGNPPVVANPIPNQVLGEGENTTISLNNVFDDPDGDALFFTARSSNTSFVTVSITNGVSLQVNGISQGQATVTVTASDGDPTTANASDEFTVTVTADIPPTANNDMATTDEDMVIFIPVLNNDEPGEPGVPLDIEQVRVVGMPDNGTAVAINDGTIAYDPADDFFGEDSFTYEVDDINGNTSNVAMVTVTVVPVNDPPEVTITSPTEGARFVEGTDIEVVATASDIDGTITQVEFLDGMVSLGVDSDGTDGFSITLQNAAVGTYNLTAVATDDGGEMTTSAQVTIEVDAAPDPTFSLDPTSHDFGDVDVDGGTGSQDFTLQNTGTGTLSGDVSLTGTDAAAFSITAGAGNYNLDGGASLTITVQFDPQTAGPKTASLTITHNDVDATSPFEASLTGNGTANQNPVVEAPIADQMLTVGDGPTTVADLDDVFSDPDGDALMYTAMSDMEAVATVSIEDATNNLRVTAVGEGTATITVTANDGNGGTVNDVFEVVVEAAPAISLDPASHNFGDVTVGDMPTQDFTLTNTGGGTLSGTVSISGDEDFTITAGEGAYSLGAGASLTITVQFAPGSAGMQNAMLSITHNADNETSPLEATVSGNGVEPPPAIMLDPGSHDFGSVMVLTSETQDFTLTNTGGGTLSGTVSISGDEDFTITAGEGAYSLGAGASLTITVQFSPATPGSKSATLSITHNDSEVTSPLEAALSGQGTP